MRVFSLMGPVPRLLLLTALLGACSIPSRLPTAENAASVAPGQVVLIGKIEISPALSAADQDIEYGLSSLRQEAAERNTFIAGVDDGFVLIPKDQIGVSTKDYFLAKFGSVFQVRRAAQPAHLNWLSYYGTYKPGRMVIVRLPAGYRFDVRPEDRAVYVGTIRMERNEYGDITRIAILDQWDRERAEFEKRFGRKLLVAKRLAIPLDDHGQTVTAKPSVKDAARKPQAKADNPVQFAPLQEPDSPAAAPKTPRR